MASEDKNISKLLRKFGYGFPQTEEEVNSFEEKFKKSYEKPKNWPELSDIISSTNKDKKVINLSFSENKSVSNLAMAAREGKEISKKTMEQMKKDKKDARKK
ncbi:hypothetical protein [uncultured Winogradskyella sp.]|uniref:hypothetical protein n=1 Tax=uncultured Winogradskyella sp. TaxID=395353 RepID=UPI0030DCA2FA|tara:strand:- start:4366 stop:4671 length:306 start_codon:yes stop_codon:yes gene_type:complete